MFDANLKPNYLWLETTDRCNSKCAFCNIWKKSPTENMLTPTEIETALKDPVFKRLKAVVVSGGELTLRKDIKEIIMSIHKAVPKAELVLNSNGILSDRLIDVVQFSLDNNKRIHVGVSLDGIGTNHDRLRGVPGLFQKIDSLFYRLLELKKKHGNRLKLSAGFVLSNATVTDLLPVKRYVERLGVEFNLQWFIAADYYENTEQNLLSDTFAIEQAIKEIPPTIVNDKGIRFLHGESIKYICFSMFNFCLLKCNGDIVPCFDMWDLKIGNIREMSPSGIWKSKEAGIARQRVRKCQGCLSNCAIPWSYGPIFFPQILFNLRHPEVLMNKIIKRTKS